MKNLFVILLLLVSRAAFGQTIQTSINGWNCLVTLPADYNATSIKYPALIFFPGLGEVGTDINKLKANGPHAYLAMAGASIPGFIVISLQPPTNHPRPPVVEQRMDSLLKWYRIDSNRINLTGLSHGGWVSWIYATYKPTPTTNYRLIKSVIDVEGGFATDNYGATLPGEARYAEYGSRGGKGLGFEQVQDYRGMQNINAAMNGAVPGSFQLTYTNFGNGGHCCWNRFYGGQGVQPGVFTIFGVQRNIYQWLAQLNAFTITPLDNTVHSTVSRKVDLYYDGNAVYLKNAKATNWALKTVTGQQIKAGFARPGNSTIPITNLPTGVYIFITELRVFKILKY